ncbi:unnamed protein product, partial [marine sediment metagenome]
PEFALREKMPIDISEDFVINTVDILLGELYKFEKEKWTSRNKWD